MTLALPGLNELLDHLAERVADKLRTQPKDYDTRDNLAPGTRTSRNARAIYKRIPGAYRVGKVWVCPVYAWDAYHRENAASAPDESGELDAYDAAVARGGRR